MQGSVRKRGEKWYYSYELATIDGKRKRVERVGGRTKKEAQDALRKALSEYEKTGRHQDQKGMSIDDLLSQWINEYVMFNNAITTKEGYEKAIHNHILPAFSGRKITTITPMELQAFINEKYSMNYSSSYLSRMRNVLRMSFDYAVNPCQYLKESPMNYVKIPKLHDKKTGSDKVLSTADFNKLVDYFKNKSQFLHLMIGFYTGFRIGEVTALTWDDIDFKKQTISVNKTTYYANRRYYIGDTKTKGSIRTISIGKTLLGVLREAKKKQLENRLYYGKYYKEMYLVDEKDEKTGNVRKRIHEFDGYSSIKEGTAINFVCLQENGALVTTGTFKSCPDIARKKLDIDFNFHMLRHTHATTLISNGANIKAVQERLGHESIKTTMDIYAHVTPKMESDLVNIIEAER